jgi:hypothetical protein
MRLTEADGLFFGFCVLIVALLRRGIALSGNEIASCSLIYELPQTYEGKSGSAFCKMFRIGRFPLEEPPLLLVGIGN